MTTPQLDYSEHLEALKDAYEPKIMNLLERIARLAREGGYAVNGPYDMCADEYRWSMLINVANPESDSTGVDVYIEIAEEREYEGGDGWGLNFGLSIVHYGSRAIGGFQPYNYTPDVWVDSRDADAVRERWELFTSADIEDIMPLLDENVGKDR